MYGNLNVRQATSQQLFKVITFCMDTCFQSFSPLINRIVLFRTPCSAKIQPMDYQDCWLVTCQD